MKRILLMMMLVLGLVSGVRAETLTHSRAWAERTKTEDVRNRLGRLGAGSDEQFELITDDWKESAVVDVALETNRIDLLAWVLERDTLSEESVRRVLDDQGARERPSNGLWSFVGRLPRDQRDQFEVTLHRLAPHRFGTRPVFGELYVKYQVLRGHNVLSGQSETEDLARLLVAVEPLGLRDAERLRESVKWNAIRLARHQLREEGLSFVAVDDVNPLEDRVRPVVNALNEAGAEGLEQALRDLGAEVEDFDRRELLRQGDAWRERILLGDMSPSDASHILGKLSVALGVDGFNDFVEVYNHGERGPVREAD
ncbi:MAG: hypothetical protein JJU29_18470 [Verrucomicrobia bacterium]|nr:hypothetical protein [Verrucomicrobiota bacterium]MCH8512330.1 hypothetical protein [Kiritimatiellia bacterium]